MPRSPSVVVAARSLRWFVLVCAGFCNRRFAELVCNSLKGQLSGAGCGIAVTAVVVCVLLLSLGMSMIGSVVSKPFILGANHCPSSTTGGHVLPLALHITNESGKPLATFYGGGGTALVSAYEGDSCLGAV